MDALAWNRQGILLVYMNVVSSIMVILWFWVGVGWFKLHLVCLQWCFVSGWLWLQQCVGGSGGASSAVYAPWLQVVAPTAVAAASSLVVALQRRPGGVAVAAR